MPGYFKFMRKNSQDDTPVAFSTIDDEMRVHFGAPPDEKNYFRGWYDPIGMALAMGSTLEKMIATPEAKNHPDTMEILVWLNENFRTDAWYSRMK
jgi:hypothetical protein